MGLGANNVSGGGYLSSSSATITGEPEFAGTGVRGDPEFAPIRVNRSSRGNERERRSNVKLSVNRSSAVVMLASK